MKINMEDVRLKLKESGMSDIDIESTLTAFRCLDNIAEFRIKLVKYKGEKEVVRDIYRSLVTARNHLFLHRNAISLALNLKQSFYHDEESSVFGEEGLIMEVVNELSDCLDQLREIISL